MSPRDLSTSKPTGHVLAITLLAAIGRHLDAKGNRCPQRIRVAVLSAASERWAATSQLELCRVTRTRVVHKAEYSLGSRILDTQAYGYDRKRAAHPPITLNRILGVDGPGPRQSSVNTNEIRWDGSYPSARGRQIRFVGSL